MFDKFSMKRQSIINVFAWSFLILHLQYVGIYMNSALFQHSPNTEREMSDICKAIDDVYCVRQWQLTTETVYCQWRVSRSVQYSHLVLIVYNMNWIIRYSDACMRIVYCPRWVRRHYEWQLPGLSTVVELRLMNDYGNKWDGWREGRTKHLSTWAVVATLWWRHNVDIAWVVAGVMWASTLPAWWPQSARTGPRQSTELIAWTVTYWVYRSLNAVRCWSIEIL